jgi:hypothetical protein
MRCRGARAGSTSAPQAGTLEQQAPPVLAISEPETFAPLVRKDEELLDGPSGPMVVVLNHRGRGAHPPTGPSPSSRSYPPGEGRGLPRHHRRSGHQVCIRPTLRTTISPSVVQYDFGGHGCSWVYPSNGTRTVAQVLVIRVHGPDPETQLDIG